VSWQIDIPFRDRSAPLTEVAECARALPNDEERTIVRSLVLGEITRGSAQSVGDLIDKVEQASPAERREMLDQARVKAGLPTTAEVEGRQRFEAACATARAQGAAQSPWQLCHAEGCSAAPVNHLGAPVPVDVIRWFCAAHIDQAARGDMEPRGSGLRIAPSGAIVPVDDPAEQAKQAAAAESRRRALEEEQAERAVEAEAKRRHDEARAAETRRLLPPRVPG
jgi:hypothetical protein